MRTEQEMIAYALEIDPELLPFVPELLADLDELGTDPELIVDALASLQCSDSARVLDLGCGKGAVSIAIAANLGLHVTGVDLFQPFIDTCIASAAAAGVSHLCTFRQADIFKFDHPPVDIAIYGALGDVLGPMEQTVGTIRRFVKPGGYLVIADDYLRDDAPAPHDAFASCTTHDETVRQLTAHGDHIAREIVEPHHAMVEENAANNAAIRRRAQALGELHPHLKAAFLAFADDQEDECEYMEQHLVSAIWLVRTRRLMPGRSD